MDFLVALSAVVVGLWLYKKLDNLIWYIKFKIRDARDLKKINAERTAQGLESFLSLDDYSKWEIDNLVQQLNKEAEEHEAAKKAEAARKRRAAAAKKAAAEKKPVAKKAPVKKPVAKKK